MFRLVPVALVTLACCADSSAAQDFRIVTTIKNLDQEPASHAVTTLTLFRQRKVYDYIDTLGEVIIYEPGTNQFTILNVRRSLATTVHFDEIKKMLRDRKPEIERYVRQLRTDNDPIAEDVASAFDFQLDPKFEESFNRTKKELTLLSPRCVYRVKCEEIKSSEQTAQYLEYADWMARLNSVLHPGAMFPEPRIALNASLRRHNRIPIHVELNSKLDGNLHLAAEHQISFGLENRDRTRITDWESALRSPRITRTTFRRYQQVVLTAQK
ncbi:MAG: hypothetical protein AB8G99_19320 [Planctomycetaceae bacterium]